MPGRKESEANGGHIPTNIGLDGAIGGEYGGKWYKGTYGWNFTIFDGEIERIAHRNNFDGGHVGRVSATPILLTGDAGLHRHPPPPDGQHLRSKEGRRRPAHGSPDVRGPPRATNTAAGRVGTTGQPTCSPTV